MTTDPYAALLGYRHGRYTFDEVRAVLRAYHGDHRRRSVPLRLRATTTVTDGRVTGLASVYGVAYPVSPGLDEVIEQGAFATSARERPRVPLYTSHDWSTILGHADLADTPDALRFDATVYRDTDAGIAWHRAAKSGAIDGVSIGFIARDVINDEPGLDRVLLGEVLEASLTLRPANPAARVQSVA